MFRGENFGKCSGLCDLVLVFSFKKKIFQDIFSPQKIDELYMLYSYNKILGKAVLANPATPRKGLFSKVHITY